MTIKLNKENKKYIVSYSKRHPKTGMPIRRQRTNIETASKAKKVEAELVILVNDLIRRQEGITWGSFLRSYLVHIKQSEMSENTTYGIQKMLERYTLQAWETKNIDSITTYDIHQILNDHFMDKAESHRKYFVKCIRSAFRHAVETDLLIRNPTPLLKFKLSDKISSVLNEEEIRLLLTKAQEHQWEWYPHYALALYTGMRNGELYALPWQNVDLHRRQILVNCSWSSKVGYKSTKSGHDRIVEIPLPLIPVLNDLKKYEPDTSFVLPRLSKWDKGDQARYLRAFLMSVGLPMMRFHDLRASWATLLLNKGVAPSKVMSMGGWRDMDTMMIYMRKAGIDIKGSTSVLDGLHTHCVKDS
ncbi:site-specific integrase [Bdellovibrio sp. ZAP7]|uniref:tyrosine-type recombinase/integrase n=1 Tax=Bdellovibrio sp. ZAP7 TaxID=2231053 RepID=UPI0011598F70|nr:site-specific integrase [Bdellovibrio sp. ZAP7]QDK43866.1 site-specific integrase [Bdellovibrio sp. ZAP7]